MKRRKPFSQLSKKQKRVRLNYISNQVLNQSAHVLPNFESQDSQINNENVLNPLGQYSIPLTPIVQEEQLLAAPSHSHQVTPPLLLEAIQFVPDNQQPMPTVQEPHENLTQGSVFNQRDQFSDDDDEAEIARQNFFNVQQPNRVQEDGELHLPTDLALWVSQNRIKMSATNGLLKLFRRHPHGEYGCLPVDSRTLMKTPKNVEVVPLGAGEFTHYGLEKAIIEQLKAVGFFDFLTIYIDLFVDGIPIFKSRNLGLVALLGKIVHPLFGQPFLISGYYGKEKAPNVHDFMASFQIEYSQLEVDGFTFEGHRYIVKVRLVTSDTVARNWILEHPTHLANQACEKCFVYGFKVGGAMTFPDLNAPLKTDENFRALLPYPFNEQTSPIEEMGLGPVSRVPLEIMHQGHLGLMKRFLNYWMDMFGKGEGAQQIYEAFDESYKSLAKCVPMEFARKPRSILEERKFFKATEYRLMLLYLAPAATRQLLPHNYIVHFNALNCAMRILSDPELCIFLNSEADKLLRYFVENVEFLYGREHMVFCVHSAIHLAADVLNFGSLEEYSSYAYENFLGWLKSLIRSSSSPLSQLVKRLSEKNLLPQESKTQQTAVFLSGKKPQKDQEKLFDGFKDAHGSIDFPDFKLTDTYPNNFCYLSDHTLVSIESICYRNEEPVIIGKSFLEPSSIPDYPCDSTSLGIIKVRDLSENLQFWSISSIRKKMFQIPVMDHFYMFPIIHSSTNSH
ncbi:hypothetical protein QAD02_016791 [Eretmocerus hayati]|uniref:Uncharacterized protein n=1 Tax=Eretmocerus hayati TaxID=131215 RepID=A0ACC2PEL2_9HYME|nr:hypothetical protein QAD02_016791 [Eretmocerus hayati]